MEKDADFAQLDVTALSQLHAWEEKLSRELGAPIVLVAYEEKYTRAASEVAKR